MFTAKCFLKYCLLKQRNAVTVRVWSEKFFIECLAEANTIAKVCEARDAEAIPGACNFNESSLKNHPDNLLE
jgi:hypothetical protein